ncbi:MAG: Chemotaxis protein PomA [Phycisphaerae bacterium]|nr:Chemotaxis protein PomA [Phycisphaerae bacterium]
MDLATIIGLLTGFSLVLWSMLMGGTLQTYIDVPSIVMVGGGTVGAILTSFPLKKVFKVMGVIKRAFLFRTDDPQELIKTLVKYAEVARRDGILALESMTKNNPNAFLVTGVQMAIDGTDPELIEQTLTSELEILADRHSQGKALLECLGKYAPAYGMIGTLVGLVVMLKNMSDPSAIGPGMAVAILTTFYGAVASNMLFLPMADKLGVRSAEELMIKSMVLKGILSIQSGDNPRIVEQKLKVFLPPAMRKGRDL